MFSDTTKLYTDTTPIDKDYAAAAVKELYCYCNTSSYLPREDKVSPSRNPEIIFVNGPNELKEKIATLYELIGSGYLPESAGEFFFAESFNDVTHFVTKRGHGPKERMRSVLAHIFDVPILENQNKKWRHHPMMLAIDWLYHEEGEEGPGYIDPWEKVATKVWDNAYLIVTFIDKCYVVNRPLEVHVNEMGFHCVDGPAISFRDGSEIYCYEGLLVDRKHIMEPESLTLEDIHRGNNDKHYLIDLIGVDNYLEMVNEWKVPEVKDRFKKFFGFSKMVLPTDDEPEETDERGLRKFKERGYGYYSYKDSPYEVDIFLGKVNGEFGLVFSPKLGYNTYHFSYKVHPLDTEYGENLFNPEDRELLNLFNLKEVFSRGASKLTLSYQNRKFSLKSGQTYEGFKGCRHDVAPSWFKVKIFRNEFAYYENKELNYVVKYEDGKLLYAGDMEQGESCIPKDEPNSPLKIRDSLFGGCENLPSYNFDINLEADSWEGLLEKWARFSFEWLSLHEDSTRLP